MMRRGSNVEEDIAYEIVQLCTSTNVRATPFGKIIGRNCSQLQQEIPELRAEEMLACQQRRLDML